MSKEDQLKKLYMESSKHSNYQILPNCLKDILKENELNIKSRQEQERFDYICKHLDFTKKKVLDIGGNTGFFSFESITAGASHVDYYEGNTTHAAFVQMASEVLNLKNQITIFPDYYLFDTEKKLYDFVFCLNVLHHIGSDFEVECSMEKAREKILCYINKLSTITNYLVLQLGFNWCGDRNKCLFKDGTKQEMEQYVTDGTKDFWEILHIGIAAEHNKQIQYEDMTEKNNKRNDRLGEFLNRPIFIMRSKRSE